MNKPESEFKNNGVFPAFVQTVGIIMIIAGSFIVWSDVAPWLIDHITNFFGMIGVGIFVVLWGIALVISGKWIDK